MIPDRPARWAAGLSLVVLVGVSLVPVGPLPPLGPLLDPAHGIWTVSRSAELPPDAQAAIAGLARPVEVRYDDRAVPHIFAGNELDAIRALGYVVARERLFQLELQWRAGAGRLTELLGPRALPLDRESRSLGLADAARRTFESFPEGSYQRQVLAAFGQGANSWIAQLERDAIPLEYHLLGRRPARWEPINSIYLLGRMGWTLALSDLEAVSTRAAQLVGPEAAAALYPRNSPIQEPIQPNGRRSPRYELVPLPPPCLEPACRGAPGPVAGRWRAARPARDADAIGSNNWAVAPSRSASGHALLAGDPHLELTLPSIWYEAHLVVADSLDVYGVTLPGATGIVMGFTRDLAWAFTNAEADVLDRYTEVVDQPMQPGRYRVDGSWRPVRTSVETYTAPGGRVLRTDTLFYTHRGPLTRVADGSWQSIRWTVLEAGPALTALNRAARATTARAWLDSMADYDAPAQNMLVADRAGTIAIRSTGRFPLRPAGRGDLVQRGDTSASDWSGNWSVAELPQAVAPAQGFLASANQQPIDPAVDPRYLGANWYAPWRALRINELLRADSAVTPDAMRRFQTDPGSPAADRLVPALLAAAARNPGRDSVALAARLLAQWDRRYTPDNQRAVLYEATLRELAQRLWDELDPARARGEIPAPGSAVLLQLLQDPASPWWDIRATGDTIEQRDHVVADALAAGLRLVVERYGEPNAGGWRWDRIRHANIYHLLHLPGLSELRIPVQGGQSTLNPSSGSGSFGPSWRMVVELGPEVRAWGTYPGGQSGNPASVHYADRIGQWSRGELDTLRLPRTPDAVTGNGPRLRLHLADRD